MFIPGYGDLPHNASVRIWRRPYTIETWTISYRDMRIADFAGDNAKQRAIDYCQRQQVKFRITNA